MRDLNKEHVSVLSFSDILTTVILSLRPPSITEMKNARIFPADLNSHFET